MDDQTLAEELPGLYRVILDGVARLELAGERREAAQIRREATLRYSAAWDERSRRHLIGLVRRLERALAGRPSSRASRRALPLPSPRRSRVA